MLRNSSSKVHHGHRYEKHRELCPELKGIGLVQRKTQLKICSFHQKPLRIGKKA